jgi:hypothetical protein
MLRNMLIVIAAVVTIGGTLTLPTTEASARWGGGIGVARVGG